MYFSTGDIKYLHMMIKIPCCTRFARRRLLTHTPPDAVILSSEEAQHFLRRIQGMFNWTLSHNAVMIAIRFLCKARYCYRVKHN